MQQLLPPATKSVGLRPDPTTIYDEITLPDPPAHRPYTILNMVSSVDGKTTLDGGRVNELGSDLDHRLMLKLRIPVDAVVRGAGTVRSHSRYPFVADSDALTRQAAGRPPHPQVVIITGSGDLPMSAPVFQEAPRRPIIIAPSSLPAQRRETLSSQAHLITVDPLDDGPGINLPAALQQLRRKYNIQHLLSEGGPHLNYWFLQHELLDEIFWTIAPKLGGARQDLTMVDGPQTFPALPRLKLLSAYYYRATEEMFMRYKVLQP